VFIGIAFGIAGTLVASNVFMWFPAKERPIVFTANIIGSTVGSIIAYNLTIPMYSAYGWKAIFGLCAGLSLLATLLWVLLGKEFDINATGDTVTKSASMPKVNPFEGLKLAFKSKELWILTIYMTGGALANNGVNFFYPAFLNQVRGLGAAAAGSVTSLSFIAGALGSLVGGIAASTLGKRKPIIVFTTIGRLVSLAGLFVFTSVPLLTACMALSGFMGLSQPAASSATTEVPGMTPVMAAGAYSMCYGLGSLLTLFISPILGGLQGVMGLTGAMVLFCFATRGVAFMSSLLIKDNGPKAKKKLAAA
jgi:cyanate permease